MSRQQHHGLDDWRGGRKRPAVPLPGDWARPVPSDLSAATVRVRRTPAQAHRCAAGIHVVEQHAGACATCDVIAAGAHAAARRSAGTW